MKERTADPSQTFSAVLHPWAAKLTLKSRLSTITLAHVMSGDTCEPISLADFEGYLAFREHLLQNLQFIVWYRDYRKRYLAIQPESQDPSDVALQITSRVSAELRQPTGNPLEAEPVDGDASAYVTNISPPAPVAIPPSSSSPRHQRSSLNLRSNVNQATPANPTLVNAPTISLKRPFQKECMRVIATFIHPGSVKELPLRDEVRTDIIKQLASSTHPDIFLRAYRETYDELATGSLPRFLVHNSTICNLPQQLFWYGIGITDLFVGVAISISFIMSQHVPPQSRRAFRLIGVPFVAFGVMQLYSAWRGFCGRLWLRGTVQLRVWELQDVDEDAKTFWAQLLGTTESPEQNVVRHWDPVTNEYVPATDTGDGVKPSRSVRSTETRLTHGPSQHRWSSQSFRVPIYRSRNGFLRPPVFGPDKIVVDPRIKEVHRQVMNEIIIIGLLSAAVFAAIVMSVPSLSH